MAADKSAQTAPPKWQTPSSPARLWTHGVLVRWLLYMALFLLRGCNLFVFIFVFRYLRLVGNIISFLVLYRPSPIPEKPTVSCGDCSVVIATVDPLNAHFAECVSSVLANSPKQLIIVTVGHEKLDILERTIELLRKQYPVTQILCGAVDKPNKRRQVAHAIPLVTGSITVFVDDHVFWPSARFLPAAVAPFEDPHVGLVGTWKRVRREAHLRGYTLASLVNMLTCTYLMRHNFELCASNAVDAGVFVVSGRTSLVRTSIIQNDEFAARFANENFLLGMLGPLNADDDNFLTRWLVARDWHVKFQASADAVIETVIGADHEKFREQCLRWARTTWRSNTALLWRSPRVWALQPWCLYAVYITGLSNFAALWDGLLLWSATRTEWFEASPVATVAAVVGVILLSKTVKLWSHWRNEPRDILLFPANVAFAYYHSWIKLKALITFWDNRWGGRDLSKAIDDNVPEAWDIQF